MLNIDGFDLTFSKELAIEMTKRKILVIFFKSYINKVNDATVDGLSSEQVSKIIKKELTDKHMVKVNAITFHIVETRFYI